MISDAPFIPELMTHVRSIRYDYISGIGSVHMPEGCCTDMDGVIRLLERIDANVMEIHTYADEWIDASYTRSRDGKWTARLRGRRRRGVAP